MAISAIASSYWRQIKKGNRTFESVPVQQKENVRILAASDVQNGIITAEEYEQYIGEPYVVETEN